MKCYWATCSSILLGTLSFSPGARAEENGADARALFQEARQLLNAGHYQLACQKFERSYALEPGIGTEFNWADCLEKLGQPASARQHFLKVAAHAAEQGQQNRADAATERASRLLARLSRLQIQCDGPCPSTIRVFRDDVELTKANWNDAVPVDPGRYRIETADPVRLAWDSRVTVPMDPVTVVVTVPNLRRPNESAADPTPPNKAPPERVLLSVRPITPVNSSAPARSNQILPRVLFWSGVGGLVVGATSAVLLKYKNDRSAEVCPESVDCTSQEISTHRSLVGQAMTARAGVYLGFGIGVAGLSSAAILHFLNTNREQPNGSTALRISPFVAVHNHDAWGAVAEGTF